MANKRVITVLLLLGFTVQGVLSQTEQAFNGTNDQQTGLIDPSRLKVNHSVSFGMSASSASSGLKSQGLYTTMLTYQFSNPVTLNFNFGLPLFSSYSPTSNLSQKNIQSMEYFKNMPFEGALTWQPRDNLSFSILFSRNTADDDYYYSPFHMGRHISPFHIGN